MNYAIPNRFLAFLMLLVYLTAARNAVAVSGVNPTGVNVNSRGPTSVFITFQGLGAQESSTQSFWCAELINDNLPIVTSFNPCRSDTILGFLPRATTCPRHPGPVACAT